MSDHLTINRHILTADEVVAKLRAIHDDVQTKWHDQWNWINADFYVECLDSLLKSQAATIAAANKRIAELERIIASIKLADRKKADSLNSYRVDLETAIEQRDEARKEVEMLSKPMTDVKGTEFCQITTMGQKVRTRHRTILYNTLAGLALSVFIIAFIVVFLIMPDCAAHFTDIQFLQSPLFYAIVFDGFIGLVAVVVAIIFGYRDIKRNCTPK